MRNRRSHCQVVTLELIAVALAAFWSAPALAEEARPKLPEGGVERSLYVTVEEDGKLIGGLEEGNFRLWEDGEARAFRIEEPEQPATIALLVEYSQGSWPYWNDIFAAMRGFMQNAAEGNWYALATFAHELNIEVDFTKRHGRIPTAFSDMTAPMWNEADTYDAVFKMLDKMGRLDGRRVMIFIGSGFDSFSAHTLEDVEEQLERVNATVFALGAGSLLRGRYEPHLGQLQRMDLMQAQSFLQMLADKSGGWAVFPKFETAFGDAMKGVMQTLAMQYKLVYKSRIPEDGDFHEIKVTAFRLIDDEREDFEVRVREGWRTRP